MRGENLFDIIFYRLPNGKQPVREFLDSLDIKMRVSALDELKLLEEFGNQLKSPHSKPIGDGLFELRIKFSSNISRIFYFFQSGKKIVVTNGFVKKTNKTPPGEIEKAKKYKTDYEKRKTDE